MVRLAIRGLLAFGLLVAAVGAASAQGTESDRRPRGEAGRFDFYVLSLSWSPSFCAEMAERMEGRGAPSGECGTHAYGFIVHGLWPQYERGFPQYCEVPSPRLARSIVSTMLDLMPAPRLVYNEWDRHGTCSGLSPRDYFDTVRKAHAAIKIPPQYLDLQSPLIVSPAAVEDAFVSANPDLARADMAIDCEAGRLTEVRLCFSKDLKFRACPQVAADTCRRPKVLMPPMQPAVPGGR
jgi:ribonuclease T2